MTKILAVLLLATSALNLSAQNVKVSGRVVDDAGIPLVAVTVFEEGKTSNGTVTDIDGNYTLAVSSGKSSLIFSCLGFAEIKEVVGSRTTINVTLKEEQLSIDAAEVVSVGYGTVSRRDLTGSVSKVDMGELMKAPVTNFDQALTGKVAGVVVTTSDGALGTEANITIRGNNSLTQSSAPLYIIDGFPTESSMATALSSADIESIDILKDASATAIYGARGANGVVVITTKQGVDILARQIAGAMARRIVTYAKVGEPCHVNEQMGFIKFGSRVDVYLPIGTEVLVEMDQQVTGNQTPIARLSK